MDKCGHFMVFAATIEKVIVESASDSEDFSDDEVPKNMTLQETYDETTRLVETFVVENTLLEKKVKNLEVELSQARTQMERMSSARLDEVLSVQKPSSNKTGLGYDVSSSPSSSTAYGSRTVFVPQSEKGDKGEAF